MSLTATRETTPEGVRAARALRALRELRGLSRPRLADLTGLSPSALSRIEKGQARFPFDAVPVFSAALGVPQAAFLAPLHPAYRTQTDRALHVPYGLVG